MEDSQADIILIPVNVSRVKIEAAPHIIKELSELMTFEAPNYKFSPLYRSKKWDGKIRLLETRSYTTYIGLAHNIIEFAKDNGYSVLDKTDMNLTTEFSLSEANEFIKTLNLKFDPHDYQVKAFTLAVRNRRAVFLSATGSGKSLIAYLIASYYKEQKILIIVPTINLVNQLESDFVDYGCKEPIHKIQGGIDKFLTERINISTWQSIYEMDETYLSQFDVVIGDEAHGFAAKSLISLMNKLSNAKYRFGLSGTLHSTDVNLWTLIGLFGRIYTIAKTAELIRDNKLSPLKIKILVLKHLQKVPNMDYQEEIEYLISSESRNRFISNLVKSLKGNTLVIFQRIETHGKILFEMIKEQRANVHFVYGGTESDSREAIRKLVMASKDQCIVASSGVYSTGVNIPNIQNIVLAYSTKSGNRLLQTIGRGVRKAEGKDLCKVYDIADDISGSNFTLNHLRERVKLYSMEEFPYEIFEIDLK